MRPEHQARPVSLNSRPGSRLGRAVAIRTGRRTGAARPGTEDQRRRASVLVKNGSRHRKPNASQSTVPLSGESTSITSSRHSGSRPESSGPVSTKPRRRIFWESSPVTWATASISSRSLMTGDLLGKRGAGTGNTGTPAANAVSRKKGNTPGSQRGGRGERKSHPRERPRSG